MKATEAKKLSQSDIAKNYFFNEILEKVKQAAMKGSTCIELGIMDAERYRERLVNLGYRINDLPHYAGGRQRTHKFVSWKNPTA